MGKISSKAVRETSGVITNSNGHWTIVSSPAIAVLATTENPDGSTRSQNQRMFIRRVAIWFTCLEIRVGVKFSTVIEKPAFERGCVLLKNLRVHEIKTQM